MTDKQTPAQPDPTAAPSVTLSKADLQEIIAQAVGTAISGVAEQLRPQAAAPVQPAAPRSTEPQYSPQVKALMDRVASLGEDHPDAALLQAMAHGMAAQDEQVRLQRAALDEMRSTFNQFGQGFASERIDGNIRKTLDDLRVPSKMRPLADKFLRAQMAETKVYDPMSHAQTLQEALAEVRAMGVDEFRSQATKPKPVTVNGVNALSMEDRKPESIEEWSDIMYQQALQVAEGHQYIPDAGTEA